MEENIGLLVAVISPETKYRLSLLILRRVKRISFALFESWHRGMLRDTTTEKLLKLFALSPILFMVPS